MSRKYTFFVHLRATKDWLALSRAERNEFTANTLRPILAAHPQVRVRWYDAEAFTARCSDIAVFETESIPDYYFVMDAIRDSKVFTVPYFEVIEIIPAVEDGFAEYEAHLNQSTDPN